MLEYSFNEYKCVVACYFFITCYGIKESYSMSATENQSVRLRFEGIGDYERIHHTVVKYSDDAIKSIHKNSPFQHKIFARILTLIYSILYLNFIYSFIYLSIYV